MNLEELTKKAIALIIWNTEKEDDVHVYLGRLKFENGEACFINEEKGWRFSLDEEQLSRLRPVDDDLKETLLNADYAISLSMAVLPESGTEGFEKTGMKWE